jgi:hypothetical protein
MELSSSEQLANVPYFLAKVARYRPCIVCFVGLSIAKVVDTSLNVVLKSLVLPFIRVLTQLLSDLEQRCEIVGTKAV